MTDFIAKISLRGDTAANWTSNNPTLDLNEWGIENDTAVTSSGIKFIRVKRGDGATTWNSLPYANFGEFDIGTQLADLYAYVDTAVVGLWDDRGNYDASSGAYPSTDGSGPSHTILKGDTWTISVAGTLPTGQAVEVGDVIRALVDSPGNTQANWAIIQNNIDFTNIVTKTGTQTITNKRVQPRITTITSSATPTVNSDNCNIVRITSLATDITNMSTNLTGTPTHDEFLCYEITDNGTSRAISWGSLFTGTSYYSLPLLTVASTPLKALFQWNSVTSLWRLVGIG